jgi:hypothetical protein
MGHFPPNHDVGRVMAFLHPQNAPQGTFEHNLVVLVILLLNGEKFLIHEEDVFHWHIGSPSKQE